MHKNPTDTDLYKRWIAFGGWRNRGKWADTPWTQKTWELYGKPFGMDHIEAFNAVNAMIARRKAGTSDSVEYSNKRKRDKARKEKAKGAGSRKGKNR